MTQLTKALRRDIASLADAKGRRRLGAFMAEGTKCVLDTIDAFAVRHVIATPQWLAACRLPHGIDIIEANRGQIGEMSSMSLAPDVIAVYDLPEPAAFTPTDANMQLVVALDRVQDPGNLGTIIRTADWMGVTTVIASIDTVDCFNPKVIQATMGAISRVRVTYGDLPSMLADAAAAGAPIYGTFLDGDNIYDSPLSEGGIVVMGNEGRGISPQAGALVNRRLFIPPYPAGRPTSESLNVATATAIVLSQFRSRQF